jgi:hypothetical protein
MGFGSGSEMCKVYKGSITKAKHVYMEDEGMDSLTQVMDGGVSDEHTQTQPSTEKWEAPPTWLIS